MAYDLNLMRAFVTLMQERNVSRAARRLGITQPAMSATLARLRQVLNDPLFIRSRYGINPTEKARDLAPVVGAALGQLDEIVVQQQAFDPATTARRFVIATTDYFEYTLLPVLLPLMAQQAPHLRLSVIPLDFDTEQRGLVSGQVALALGQLKHPPEQVVVQDLIRERFQCIVRRDHPAVTRTLSLQQYRELEHVVVIPHGVSRSGLDHYLETAHGVERTVAVTVAHFLSVPRLIATTDYCATLPERICRSLRRQRLHKVLPLPFAMPDYGLRIAWHPRYRDDKAHQWLRQQIQDCCAAL